MHRKEHTFNNKQPPVGCFKLAVSSVSEEVVLHSHDSYVSLCFVLKTA